ncbi:hypothetical protein [Reyranella soli]|nr:hypothetical protein [Reyranella soli]
MALLIFMGFLLQACACAEILLQARLRRADRAARGNYTGVTTETVVGRESKAAQKMLSASAESLVFRIIYRAHRSNDAAAMTSNLFTRGPSCCCRS